MNLLEIIKLYTDNQRMIFTVFIIQTPLVFVTMHLYMMKFGSFDIYTKAMFVLAASIAVTMFLYCFNIGKTFAEFIIIHDKKLNPNILEITLPSIVTFSYLSLSKNPNDEIHPIQCLLYTSTFYLIVTIVFSIFDRFKKKAKLNKKIKNK